jgi:hypothetical protein
VISSTVMRFVVALSISGIAAIVEVAIAAKYTAPASEVAMLPQFCWAQYMDNVSGPQYTIHDCGVFTNHYCPALLELQRANKAFGTKKRGERVQHLQVAKKETLYTLNGIKDYPNCHIRQHVENTLKEVNTLLNIYGQQHK